MLKLNENYRNLQESYLFSDIGRKVSEFQAQHPDKRVIRMGIGDVTQPLCGAVIDALHRGVQDMADAATFKGYGPEQGYAFVREAVQGYYARRGVALDADEIFISDGAKSDVSNILDLFSADNTVLVPDPVYPVYVDTNIMAGRAIRYMDANEQNGFLPLPDEAVDADIIYLCSPNNPTGAAYDREGLRAWVDYANRKGAVILFDAAYEAFITQEDLPHSIFEIEGARTCAIEFCSLSKTAGFTGTRCGYTVVPHELQFGGMQVSRMWLRRQTTKFNGVSYIVQCGAAAVFSEEGQRQVRQTIGYYRVNAQAMTEVFQALGIWFTGGKDSPYIWFKCPNGMKSWEMFDLLLHQASVVGTPGAGFGKNGEGFFRLTAFGNHADTAEAMQRVADLLKKL